MLFITFNQVLVHVCNYQIFECKQPQATSQWKNRKINYKSFLDNICPWTTAQRAFRQRNISENVVKQREIHCVTQWQSFRLVSPVSQPTLCPPCASAPIAEAISLPARSYRLGPELRRRDEGLTCGARRWARHIFFRTGNFNSRSLYSRDQKH